MGETGSNTGIAAARDPHAGMFVPQPLEFSSSRIGATSEREKKSTPVVRHDSKSLLLNHGNVTFKHPGLLRLSHGEKPIPTGPGGMQRSRHISATPHVSGHTHEPHLLTLIIVTVYRLVKKGFYSTGSRCC